MTPGGVWLTNKPAIIEIPHEALESLDQLFYASSKGTHLLFSNNVIRDAFVRQETFSEQELESVSEWLEPILADLVQIDDLEMRRDFINSLDPAARDILVHLYFGFLDRYVVDDELPEILQ